MIEKIFIGDALNIAMHIDDIVGVTKRGNYDLTNIEWIEMTLRRPGSKKPSMKKMFAADSVLPPAEDGNALLELDPADLEKVAPGNYELRVRIHGPEDGPHTVYAEVVPVI